MAQLKIHESDEGALDKSAKKQGYKHHKGKATSEHPCDKCRNCGKIGHWVKDYWSKPKVQAHMVADEEVEELLMMAQAIEM
ncbi:hypothetical protein GUJ93_ZPchr0074g33538 [Zizania palustris]|uniref:CCHC-type domain-containing protein n=1 Tax=Zizania palustris TaxID=103762 RepID=A0A8J5R2R1_ZIZPA|nr:hypothetical protein GUJ93_ZPchr0074g33538 [Zizania palustris]